MESIDLPPEEKLKWLEEANGFINTYVGQKRLKL